MRKESHFKGIQRITKETIHAMYLLMNDVKQRQNNVIIMGPKNILQIDANSSHLLVISAARKGTYKQSVKRKNMREKMFAKSRKWMGSRKKNMKQINLCICIK